MAFKGISTEARYKQVAEGAAVFSSTDHSQIMNADRSTPKHLQIVTVYVLCSVGMMRGDDAYHLSSENVVPRSCLPNGEARKFTIILTKSKNLKPGHFVLF
eukprot:TRINITY_DN5973_c0_g1_i1.p1 TRINITY_DN5973_c0_g1~~TRINITY_DN5973_c0_g1_i1.p1  ORF type:complete len:101 (-),score=0.06 TRINITY_DN5973_c0_g1_i1:9-311(-)